MFSSLSTAIMTLYNGVKYIVLWAWAKLNVLWVQDQRFYNFVLAFSVFGAALWTVTTFEVLQQKETAQAQLEELQNRIRNTESSTIIIKSKTIDYKKVKGLIVDVDIKNNGTDKLFFDLTDKPLVIYKVEADGDKMGYTNIYKPKVYTSLAKIGEIGVKNKFLTCQSVLVSSTKKLSYFVTLNEPGLYYVTFTAYPKSTGEHDTNDNDCGRKDIIKEEPSLLDRIFGEDKEEKKQVEEDNVRWFSSTYINVEEESQSKKKTNIVSDNELSAVYFMKPNQKVSTLP